MASTYIISVEQILHSKSNVCAMVLWFYDSQIAGSNVVGDGQHYELFL